MHCGRGPNEHDRANARQSLSQMQQIENPQYSLELLLEDTNLGRPQTLKCNLLVSPNHGKEPLRYRAPVFCQADNRDPSINVR